MKQNNYFFTIFQKLETIKKLFGFSKGNRAGYFIALFINALSMIRYSFIIGFPIKWVSDSAFAKDWDQLKKNLVITGIILLVNMIVIYLEGYLMDSSAVKISGNIKRDLFKKILHLPSAFFDVNHSGILMSRLTEDVEETQAAISFDLVDTINYLSLGLGSLVFIAILNFELAIICTLLSIFLVVFNFIFLKPVSRLSSNIQAAIGKATARYSDIINAIPVIKMFNLSKWVHGKYDDESKTILNEGIHLIKVNSLQRTINVLLEYFFSFGILGIGAVFLFHKKITPGSLLALMRYSSVLSFAFIGTGECLSRITKLLSGAERVLDIIDEDSEGNGYCLSRNPDTSGNEIISFNNVCFSYNENGNVLSNISETICRGETIALVGESGSGKSSFLKLIMRFYDLKPENGNISFYGKNIHEYSLKKIRDLITYVPQSNYLFDCSIRENILLGKEDATSMEIEEVAKKAHAHHFIMDLKDGYNTRIGERGSLLSGGQRQRIAIARALIKNAPILLLDEATSSLDTESETEIQKALEELMIGKTVVTTAHRLSTIQHADRILVFEKGRIIERDTHDELVKQDSRYAQYFNLQTLDA